MLTETIALSALLLAVLTVRRKKSPLALLPIAPLEEASFFWGHELRIFNAEICAEYLRWTINIGPVFRIKAALFRRDLVIVSDVVAVNHIFQNAYTYIKSDALLPLIIKIGGRGLVWAEGEEHKNIRRMVSHAFTATAVKGMTEDVVKCAEKCVARLTADIERNEDSGPVQINLYEYLSPCTLEAISRVGFGQNFDHNSAESKAIGETWRNDVQNMSKFPGFLAPVIIDMFPWALKLPIPALHEDGIAKKIILDIGNKLLSEKQGDMEGGNDILSLLVKDSALTKDQMLQNIVSFIMAGHETTTGTLAATMLDLVQNPDAQTKLRLELQNVDIGDYEALEKLEYLDAVIREGLRLHPTAHDRDCIATQADVIPLSAPITLSNRKTATSLTVNAGDRFVVPFTVVNTNPAVWGPDGPLFKPERWLVPGGVPPPSQLPRGPYGNISSFLDGPRVCIGWRLALMELKVLLAFMIRAFEFRDTGVKIEKRFAPVLQMFVDGEGSRVPVYAIPV